jgi:TolA-binding protein
MKDVDYLDIEKYLQGELSDDELQMFNKRLNSEVDFAKEVALYEDINKTLTSRAVHRDEENKLRKTLKNLSKEQDSKPTSETKKEVKVFRLKSYTKFLVAASIVLFLGVLIFKNGQPSFNNFSNYDNLELVVRGDSDKSLIKAQEAFNSKDYKTAADELSNLVKKYRTKIELQLYLAISLIEIDKFELAEKILDKIIKGKSVYVNKATWHLALSKLKQKDYEACKMVLKTISKDADEYKEALKLLEKL